MHALEKLLIQSKQFALSEAERTQVPSPFHVEYTYTVGQRLAARLHADTLVVGIGTYLMDCLLGQAYQQGIMSQHIAMSAQKATEFLKNFPEIDIKTQANIIACVNEHHGAQHFSTVESEICCNADCYKFASIEGFVGGIHHSRSLPIPELLKLYQNKAEEKWLAVTLPSCKKELLLQYEIITKLIKTGLAHL